MLTRWVRLLVSSPRFDGRFDSLCGRGGWRGIYLSLSWSINPRLSSFSLSSNCRRFCLLGAFLDPISNKLLQWSINETKYNCLAGKTHGIRYWLARETIVDERVFYLNKDYCIPDVGKFWMGDRQSLLAFQSISATIRKRVLRTRNKGFMLDTFSKHPRFLLLASLLWRLASMRYTY